MLCRRRFKMLEVPSLVREREGGESMYSGIGTKLYYPFKCALASFIVMLRLL